MRCRALSARWGSRCCSHSASLHHWGASAIQIPRSAEQPQKAAAGDSSIPNLKPLPTIGLRNPGNGRHADVFSTPSETCVASHHRALAAALEIEVDVDGGSAPTPKPRKTRGRQFGDGPSGRVIRSNLLAKSDGRNRPDSRKSGSQGDSSLEGS